MFRMKNVLKKIFCITSSVLLIGCLTACSSGSEIDDLSKTLGIDLSGGMILSSKETHGGFHGDGETYVEISFDGDSGTALADVIADNSDWCAFPLSDNLQTVIYGRIDGNTQYVAPYITDDEGEAVIPPIEHGYYYFYDRHSESDDPKDDAELLSRYSINFTVALYDTDNHMLYCYALDT